MADANPIQPYNYGSSQANDFERKGHPGKWKKVVTVNGGSGTTVWFTGSNYGAGAIIANSSAGGTIYLSDGGSINAGILAKTHIHEFSIERIVDGTDLYVLFRNHAVR